MRGMALCFPAVDENFWITPPRARGRRNGSRLPRHPVRITPACAGKTVGRHFENRRNPDHPRMRGENASYNNLPNTGFGSPPHARGRPLANKEGLLDVAITPACAGKTVGRHFENRRNPDHPRMRGENASYNNLPNTGFGSPPHARGRLGRGADLANQPGITPACAGKTRTIHLRRRGKPDHPRMRGEDHS